MAAAAVDVTKLPVFISYSHDSPEHSQRVLQLADCLRAHGVDAELDQYHTRPPKGWPHWCEEQLREDKSGFVLVICTETYLKRVEARVAADEGRGVYWEGAIIYSYLYAEKGNSRFIPVLLPGASEEDIPRPLRDGTRYYVNAFDLTDGGFEALYRELTGQPGVIKPPLGERVPLSPRTAPELTVGAPLVARPALSTFVAPIDISRIVQYAPAQLIGREAEIALLDDAWAKAQADAPGRPRVMTFVALGGEGKTSLVAHWATRLASDNWPGCEAAFAWSFYSQGSSDQHAASADLFFDAAMQFFGVTEVAGKSAYERGRALAEVVAGRRALLILDGLEPLQYPPTAPTPGELKDQGLAALLKALAQSNRGLCLVTTRCSVPDLKGFRATTAPETELKRLPLEGGVALLRALHIKGAQSEFEALVEEAKGHALTLTLIGSYLRDAHDGDIRKRDLFDLAEANAEEKDGRAFHAMDAYVRWLGQDEKGRRALAILRCLGLFNRPADAASLEALWRKPEIPGLTEPLMGLNEAQRNIALTRLEDAKLVTRTRDGSGALLSLDAHPLLREYFSTRLREGAPEAFRAAHKLLFEHLCTTTPDKKDAKIEDLQPLYAAVAHGCLAGLQQRACEEVYLKRICREGEFHSVKKLGAFGADLGAVTCFFDKPWSQVSPALALWQPWLLGEAAFRLRALGRLREALEPMQTALNTYVAGEIWGHAAIGAGNLSETYLALGEVSKAGAAGAQSVAHADRSGNIYRRMFHRTTHADALHQSGRRDEAETLFRAAEAMQAERQPAYPLLYSLSGFRYCDLLIAAPERAAWQAALGAPSLARERCGPCGAVTERAEQTFKIAEENHWLLDIGLDQLTLGRAALYAALLDGAAPAPLAAALNRLAAAVDALRSAGAVEFLARGLLSRAMALAVCGQPEDARADLEEAVDIAARGPMPLHLADVHLHRARLFGLSRQRPKKYPEAWGSAAADLAEARRLIEKHGYWRRKEELEDAEAALRALTVGV